MLGHSDRLVILIGTGSVDKFGKGDRPVDVPLSPANKAMAYMVSYDEFAIC